MTDMTKLSCKAKSGKGRDVPVAETRVPADDIQVGARTGKAPQIALKPFQPPLFRSGVTGDLQESRCMSSARAPDPLATFKLQVWLHCPCICQNPVSGALTRPDARALARIREEHILVYHDGIRQGFRCLRCGRPRKSLIFASGASTVLRRPGFWDA